MAKTHSTISHQRLLEVISYDPEAGEFRWRVDRPGRWKLKDRMAGAVRGPRGKQYLTIDIDQTRYYAHKLAWLYVHGEWPSSIVDHRDLNRLNNRISNLRLCNHSQNGANALARPGCTSRFKGVSWCKQTERWVVRISINGVQKNLGRFDTEKEAAMIYDRAARKSYGEFARTNF